MSAREVEAIKAFVRDGGLLIADFAPAIMDEHGKLLDNSPLLAVFGEFKRLETRTFGKGKAVYLADYVKGYSTQRSRGLSRGACDGMTRVLTELAGVTPFASIKDEAGNTRQDISISKFQHGGASYYTLLRMYAAQGAERANAGAEGQRAAGQQGTTSSQVRLTLPTKGYLYEVRDGADLGVRDTVEAEFAPGEARIYAQLPAKIDDVRLRLDKAQYRPGEEVSITGTLLPVALKDCGLVARLTVRRGEHALPYYAANLLFTNGAIAYRLPLALNEAPGEYTVTIREIVSGREAVQTFRVLP
jgi:hypothetical protein